MQPMTPDERFLRMENLMQSLTESQVQLQLQHARLEAETEKNAAAIRDLIVISRSVIEAQKKTDVQIDKLTSDIQKLREEDHKLREAQKITEEKLHALIETVDRIIRNQKAN
jgi:hypothetical protein